MARSVNHRIWVGLALVILGGLFLLDNYNIIYFDVPYWIFRWQSILIIIGLLVLASSDNKSVGIVLIVIGGIGYAPELWPLLLIGLGIYVLYKRRDTLGHKHNKTETNTTNTERGSTSPKDIINDVAIFGGGKKVIQSDNFKGGNITAIFGGSEIDLTDCKLAEGENTIDVFIMFGGTDIIAPRDWKILIDVLPIFGGFSEKRMRDPNLVQDPERTLVIKGIAVFGGGSVKY